MIRCRCQRGFSFCTLTVPLLFWLGLTDVSQLVIAAERLPLQKKKLEIGQPAPYTPELEGYDKKGNPIYWDPKPHVVPLGDGKYAFKWTGHSGRELTLIYQRPDDIDVVAEGSAVGAVGSELDYRYKLRNLPSSKLYLGGFFVQTYSATAQAVRDRSVYAGEAAAFVKEFSVGRWFGFSVMTRDPKVLPGKAIIVVLKSRDLPGLVECRAVGGNLTRQGVGEEPPTVLEDLYLRHDAWPHGYTIGPDERLGKMSVKERSNYLVQHLPQMLELGWVEDKATMEWYRDRLQAGKAAEVRARAKADFDNNLITSEVLALMTYLLP